MKRKNILGIVSNLDKNLFSTPPIISRMGGRLRRYDFGGRGNNKIRFEPQAAWAEEYANPSPAPDFSDNPKYPSQALEDTAWGTKARREIFGETPEAGITVDTSSAKGSKFDWAGMAKDAVPFISNIANSFRKLPAPYQPVQESYFRSPRANLSASRNSIERYLRTTQQGNRLGLGNKQVAAANSADAMGKAIEGNNQVNQQEAQLQNQADLQTNYVNSMVGARNTGRSNDYLQSILNQKLAQQQLQYDNLADAGEKYGLQRRDKAQMRMEDRKLDILSRFYKDTGVYNRNVKDLAGNERYATSRFGGPTGGNSVAYITYPNGGPLPLKGRIKAAYPSTTLESRLFGTRPITPSVSSNSFVEGATTDIPTLLNEVVSKYRYAAPNVNTPIYNDYVKRNNIKTYGKGGWIQKAVNPAHKGYCTPMTKSTCTGRRRALAMTFKKHHGFH